jgi:hypothetical protein
MGAIRVSIGDMPLLLRSLVEGILDEDPQFEIIFDGAARRPSSERNGIDVLVVTEIAMRQTLPHPIAWDANGGLGIVAIAPDGLDAAVMRLKAHRRRLDDGSRLSLSQAILDAAGVLPESG